MFGFGMVLASGCGSKTLVRIGGGNLKSLVVFVVLGLSAWATLRGATAVLRTNTVDQVQWQLPSGQTSRHCWPRPAWAARPSWRCGPVACWALPCCCGPWPAPRAAAPTCCWVAWARAPWWWRCGGGQA